MECGVLSRVRPAPPAVLVVVCVLMYLGYFMVAVLGFLGYRTASWDVFRTAQLTLCMRTLEVTSRMPFSRHT